MRSVLLEQGNEADSNYTHVSSWAEGAEQGVVLCVLHHSPLLRGRRAKDQGNVKLRLVNAFIIENL